jgi:hypothetical protein
MSRPGDEGVVARESGAGQHPRVYPIVRLEQMAKRRCPVTPIIAIQLALHSTLSLYDSPSGTLNVYKY